MNERVQTGEVPAVEIAKASSGGVKESLFKRLLRRMFPDQRKQPRVPVPPLVGYLGTVRGSRPFEVGDVSLSGFSLVTDERWEPGTEMPITLMRTNIAPDQHEDRFTIQATAVRRTSGGVAFSVVLSEEESSAISDNPLRVPWASRREMRLFLERLKGPQEIKLPIVEERAGSVELDAIRAAFNAGNPALTHGAGD
jgi:hypothetical protein